MDSIEVMGWNIEIHGKNGVEIRPSLITVSLENYDTTMIEDRRPNHLDGDKNDIVFNWIRDTIDGKS